MVIYAPAKVNLCLKVLGKRPDGFHNIETVFERIALSDKIVLRPLKSDKIKLFCDNPDVPLDKDSLIYRTISLFRKRKKIRKGVEIKISKRIPIAAGLGGGSSDAASVLTGLNKLWKPSLRLPALLEFGGKLGSDIPFFLKNCSFAAARGKGDEIMPLDWKIKFWHLLISLPVRLLSKDIYEAYTKRLSSSLNDLEGVVLKKAPVVVKFKNALKRIGLPGSIVSGSGPSIFSLFANRKGAIGAKELLIRRFPLARDKGCQIFIVPTL
jgi:4-diphosphocytidyl-2-C-methyl-D-erythritol kinase